MVPSQRRLGFVDQTAEAAGYSIGFSPSSISIGFTDGRNILA
jgi:hypothetical protein